MTKKQITTVERLQGIRARLIIERKKLIHTLRTATVADQKTGAIEIAWMLINRCDKGMRECTRLINITLASKA